MMSKPGVILLVAVFSLTHIVLAYADECGTEESSRMAACNAQWGYDTSGFDISRLLEFCSQPDRPDIFQCARDALEHCDTWWEREKNTQMMTGQGVTYICSKIDVLQESRLCLIRIMPEINDCYLDAHILYMDELTDLAFKAIDKSPNSSVIFENLDGYHTIRERLGRSIETCVLDVTGGSCGIEAGNLFANFVYGVYVNVYDKETFHTRSAGVSM